MALHNLITHLTCTVQWRCRPQKKRWQHSFTTVAHILVTRIHFVQHRSNHTEKYSKLNERLERRSKQKKNLLGEQKNCTMIDSNQNDGIIKYSRNVDDEKLLLRMECKIYADAWGSQIAKSLFNFSMQFERIVQGWDRFLLAQHSSFVNAK